MWRTKQVLNRHGGFQNKTYENALLIALLIGMENPYNAEVMRIRDGTLDTLAIVRGL